MPQIIQYFFSISDLVYYTWKLEQHSYYKQCIYKIKYYCNQHKIYLCEECTEKHSDHKADLSDIISIIQKKLATFSLIKSKLENLKDDFISADEEYISIYKQIVKIYDKFIKDVITYKQKFINDCFARICSPEDRRKIKNPKAQFEKISEKITRIHTQLKNVVYESNMENIMKIDNPEKVVKSIKNISKQNNRLKSIIDYTLEYKFNKNSINSMFDAYSIRDSDGIFAPQISNENGRLQIYDVIRRKKREITINKEAKGFPLGSATCSINNLIYIAGNKSNDEKGAYLYVIDGIKGSFRVLSPMNERRSYFCLISTHPGEIVAIGGFDKSKKHGTYSLDKCEKYIINEDIWAVMPSLNQGRQCHSATYFPKTGDIYVFGGLIPPTNAPTQTIERLSKYSPQLVIWKWKTVNLLTRGGWSTIYAIQSRSISQTEILIFGKENYVFNIQELSMQKMTKPSNFEYLSNFRVSPVVYKGKIYCFNNAHQNEIVRYDIKGKKWHLLKC